MKLCFLCANPVNLNSDLCPIIFLHALFDSKRTWNEVVPHIAYDTQRMAYCLDTRNHGSSPDSKDFTIQHMAVDVLEFLHENKISKVALVGSGIGGTVAMKIALEMPDLVEKLVVESMVMEPFTPGGWKCKIRTINLLKHALTTIPEGSSIADAEGPVTNFLKANLQAIDPTGTDELGMSTELMENDDGTIRWEVNLDAIEAALLTKDFDCQLRGTYSGPVLFMCGMGSNMKIADDVKIPYFFPRAAIFTVPDSKFMPHIETPLLYMKHVAYFING